MFENPTPIPETKVWLVHGGADDYTLPGPCVEYGKKVKANGGDIKIDVREGWYHTFTGNYAVEKSPALIFHRCPPVYSKDNGQWDDEAVNYIVKHGPFESREDFELAQKEDPRAAWKGMFKAMKKAKCIDKGVHGGGDHGKEFMPEYLKFWKDNLL